MKKTLAAFVLATMVATAAHAQPGERAALGAGVGVQNYVNGGFTGKGVSVVPEYHFAFTPHSDRQGWGIGLKGGIGYTQPDRSDLIGGFQTTTGKLRMASVMVGAGPSYRTGPLRIGAGIVVGPSFNKFAVDDAARAAYTDRLGTTLNSIDVKNSMATRSDVSLWYNLSSKVGLQSSVSYTTNRPNVDTTVDGVTTRTRWNANRWGYQAGLAYGIF